MPALISYITMGAVLGLTSGISPGPLLTLVITETMKHNSKEGIRIALSPLISDMPVILISLFILSGFGHSMFALGIIAFTGGIFISYLGYECLTTKSLINESPGTKPKSIKRGVITNILNPHPYLFWITIGAPIVMKASQKGITAVIAYFFILLCPADRIKNYRCPAGGKIKVFSEQPDLCLDYADSRTIVIFLCNPVHY